MGYSIDVILRTVHVFDVSLETLSRGLTAFREDIVFQHMVGDSEPEEHEVGELKALIAELRDAEAQFNASFSQPSE